MKNPEFDNRFSFSGTITRIRKTKTCLHVTINQNVAGTMGTDFRLVVPHSALVESDSFPYAQGDTVLVQDAVLYEKANELRLRVSRPGQIKPCSEQGLVNSLSFSGKIIDVKEEKSYLLVRLAQTVDQRFETGLEVLVTKSVGIRPKPGEVGYVCAAIMYDKDGVYRAKIELPTQYKLLYSPDIIMSLGKTDASERFA